MGGQASDGPGEALSLPHLVKWAEMAVRARVERAIVALPVSSGQLFALALLQEQGEATSAELARLMYLTPQAMTTLLAPLREGGLIGRHEDQAHRRRLRLQLTERGRDVLRQARALTPGIEADVLAPLDTAERATLGRLLGAIARPLAT